jgi:hypothetical protein
MLPPVRTLPWAVAFTALFFSVPVSTAAGCKYKEPGQGISLTGPVADFGAANEVSAGLGYRWVVAVRDRGRGCVAYIQARRASGCARGRTATARITTFEIPFTAFVLPGADNVKCR